MSKRNRKSRNVNTSLLCFKGPLCNAEAHIKRLDRCSHDPRRITQFLQSKAVVFCASISLQDVPKEFRKRVRAIKVHVQVIQQERKGGIS